MRGAAFFSQVFTAEMLEGVTLQRNRRDSRAAVSSSEPVRLRRCRDSGLRRGIANRWACLWRCCPEKSSRASEAALFEALHLW